MQELTDIATSKDLVRLKRLLNGKQLSEEAKLRLLDPLTVGEQLLQLGADAEALKPLFLAIVAFDQQKQMLLARSDQPYNNKNEVHEQQLLALWDALMPKQPL